VPRHGKTSSSTGADGSGSSNFSAKVFSVLTPFLPLVIVPDGNVVTAPCLAAADDDRATHDLRVGLNRNQVIRRIAFARFAARVCGQDNRLLVE
jgi:hypothetical protein